MKFDDMLLIIVRYRSAVCWLSWLKTFVWNLWYDPEYYVDRIKHNETIWWSLSLNCHYLCSYPIDFKKFNWKISKSEIKRNIRYSALNKGRIYSIRAQIRAGCPVFSPEQRPDIRYSALNKGQIYGIQPQTRAGSGIQPWTRAGYTVFSP